MSVRKATIGGGSLIEIAGKLGELAGSQQAMLSELGRLNNELVSIRHDLDQKHEQNLTLISLRHEENLKVLAEHQKDDERQFRKIFKWFNYGSGAFIVITIIWEVGKWLIPLLLRAHLGE